MQDFNADLEYWHYDSLAQWSLSHVGSWLIPYNENNEQKHTPNVEKYFNIYIAAQNNLAHYYCKSGTLGISQATSFKSYRC